MREEEGERREIVIERAAWIVWTDRDGPGIAITLTKNFKG